MIFFLLLRYLIYFLNISLQYCLIAVKMISIESHTKQIKLLNNHITFLQSKLAETKQTAPQEISQLNEDILKLRK